VLLGKYLGVGLLGHVLCVSHFEFDVLESLVVMLHSFVNILKTIEIDDM
jgi:hypothetical protein